MAARMAWVRKQQSGVALRGHVSDTDAGHGVTGGGAETGAEAHPLDPSAKSNTTVERAFMISRTAPRSGGSRGSEPAPLERDKKANRRPLWCGFLSKRPLLTFALLVPSLV